jgi:hypothetical protein
LTMATLGVYFLVQATREKTLKIEYFFQRMVQLFSRLRHFKRIHP